MAKTSEMKTKGKYLNKEDLEELGGQVRVTIVGVKQLDVAMQGQPAQMKWVMKTRELEQLIVLNNINIELIEKALKSDDTADWRGKEITLYVDPSVMMAGKLVGGIRVAIPRPVVAEAPEIFEDPQHGHSMRRTTTTAPDGPPRSPAGKTTGGGKFDDFEDDIPF